MTTTRAGDMAKETGIGPERARKALRDEHFRWLEHNDRWTVEPGSKQHTAMQEVLGKLSSRETVRSSICQ